MKSFVKWCVAARQDALCITTVPLLFQPVILKGIGSDKLNEVCLSMKDATSIVGCNSGLHVGKRREGKVFLPPCSLTILYYCYALTLHITKPDPAYAWHSELNTSLGTTTQNHDSEPTKSIQLRGARCCEFKYDSQVFLGTFVLETSVLPTVVQPYILDVNSILGF